MTRACIALVIGVSVATSTVDLSRVPARADVPAGSVSGGIVVFAPAPGGVPIVTTVPAPVVPQRSGWSAPSVTVAGVPGPVVLTNMILTPTPATGSLVVPVRVPPAAGSGPSFMQWQLVIPGPNPAQNTAVSLAQLLNTLLAPGPRGSAPGLPVTLFSAP